MKVLFPAPVTPITLMNAHGAPGTVSGLKSLLISLMHTLSHVEVPMGKNVTDRNVL